MTHEAKPERVVARPTTPSANAEPSVGRFLALLLAGLFVAMLTTSWLLGGAQ